MGDNFLTAQQEGEKNLNGGLTLIPLPGFEGHAQLIKDKIEFKSRLVGEKFTPVDIVLPRFFTHDNREPDLELCKEHVGGHDCFILVSGPGTWEMLGQTTFVLGYLRGRRARRITLFTPYFPLSRSDKDEGSKIFAKIHLVIDQFKAAAGGHLDRIIVFDPHCEVLENSGGTGFLTRLKLTRRLVMRTIEDARRFHDKICLFFPDGSSGDRIEKSVDLFADELPPGLGRGYATKRRSSSQASQPKRFDLDPDFIRDALVILLDDEIATFGTIQNTGRKLKEEYGAKEIWAAASHGVLCGPAVERIMNPASPVDRVYVTDTIPVSHRPHLEPLIQSGKLNVIPIWEDMSWVIYCNHWDRDIREIR